MTNLGTSDPGFEALLADQPARHLWPHDPNIKDCIRTTLGWVPNVHSLARKVTDCIARDTHPTYS